MRWLLGLMLVLTSVSLSTGCASTDRATDPKVELVRVDGKMKVNGLSCPLCAHNVDASLIKVPGVAAVQTNLSTGWVELQFEDGAQPDADALDNAVTDAGFTVAQGLNGVTHEDSHAAAGHNAHAGHDMTGAGGPMVSDPDDPIIKGYGVRVDVTAGDEAKSERGLRRQLGKLPGVDAVQYDTGAATLWFTPDACLTESQVRNAVELAGYVPGSLDTVTEPRS